MIEFLNQILEGDCLESLRRLPDNCVDVCASSPPYYGLRDYGTATWEGGDVECDHKGKPFRTKENINSNTDSGGDDVKNKKDFQSFGASCGKCGAVRIDKQIGLEETPEIFIAKLVEVFREVRRVLKPTGTCWINIGDSYNGSGKATGREGINAAQLSTKQSSNAGSILPLATRVAGLKPKDLLGIPWLLAFALRADGWYLRQDIIWHKPNLMPESVTDRCTKSHEYIFLLTKSGKYFYDAEAIKEVATGYDGRKDTMMKGSNKYKTSVVPGQAEHTMAAQRHERWSFGTDGVPTRNKRSVWSIASQALKEAHFATFPEELPELCIKAGSSEHGCCAECGKPWERVVEKELVPGNKASYNSVPDYRDEIADAQSQGSNRQKDGHKPGCLNKSETIGWAASCNCVAAIVPSVVLDPFSGAGTTAMVAKKLGRDYIGCELNPEYIKISKDRLTKNLGLFQ